MKRVYIYGAGETGRKVYLSIKNSYNVLGFLDGNSDKWGETIDGKQIFGGAEYIKGRKYDLIYIGSFLWQDIKKTLLKNGVNEEKIVIELPKDVISDSRVAFVKSYALLHKAENFSVAEGGVYRGDFSKIINQCFPNSKLYLFDTFEGFDQRDIEYEKKTGYSNPEKENFIDTSEEIVRLKMLFPENIIIIKGFFPESAKGIEDSFGFVSLDFDLYQPILAGLCFFYPRMVKNSCILVHDYFHMGLPGVKEAIEEYERQIGAKLIKIPIGDELSIAILKV